MHRRPPQRHEALQPDIEPQYQRSQTLLERANTTVRGIPAAASVPLCFFNPLSPSPAPAQPARPVRPVYASPDSSPCSTPITPASPTEHVSFTQFNSTCVTDRDLPPLSSDFQQDLDEHVILTVLLYGWEKVNQELVLDAQWHLAAYCTPWLRRYHGPFEVAAILWLLRKFSTFHSTWRQGLDLGSQVPGYITIAPPPRYGERNFFDYILWCATSLLTIYAHVADIQAGPQIRSFLRANGLPFQTDRFTTACMGGVHFNWPYPIRSLYTSSDRMFRFTENFRHRLHDMKSWAMDSNFIKMFPQMRGMCYIYQGQPSSILDQARPLDREEAQRESRIRQLPQWSAPDALQSP